MIKKLLILLLICFGCESEYFSRIPNTSVYLEVYLQGLDVKLNTIGATKLFKRGNERLPYKERYGYGGILVVHGADQFYAFDMDCPYEVQTSVTVIASSDGLTAICPKCGSTFEIFNGTGAPLSGPAQKNSYYLRRYIVNQSSEPLIVYQ
ncbi:MAG: hypothetical protein Q8909_06105 [Bacteroidota bacterium]|nr:hypothetical protein [Bacteroidota bacterium]